MLARIAGSGRSRSIATALTLLAGLFSASSTATAGAAIAPGAAAGVIVEYHGGTTAAERLDTRRGAEVTRAATGPLPRTEVVEPRAGTTVNAAVTALNRDPDVAFAEPNWIRHAALTPNDPLFANTWGLNDTGQTVPSTSRNAAACARGR